MSDTTHYHFSSLAKPVLEGENPFERSLTRAMHGSGLILRKTSSVCRGRDLDIHSLTVYRIESQGFGYVDFVASDGLCKIFWLFVNPENRNAFAVKRFMTGVVQILFGIGINEIYGMTNTGKLVCLYERFGARRHRLNPFIVILKADDFRAGVNRKTLAV